MARTDVALTLSIKNKPQREDEMLRRSLIVGLALAWSACAAEGQNYPNHAVKIIVPSGPAGSYDILGRLVADQLTHRLNQTFIVENRQGGGTVVGTKAAIAAEPDGYTLLVGGLSNIIFNAGLYQPQSYDALTGLVPVALILNISYTLVGSPNLPFSTPKQIVDAAKANPGGIKLANAGVGTGQHVMGAAFQVVTGTKMLDVPYRGSSLRSLICCPVALTSSSIPRRRPCRISNPARPRASPFWRQSGIPKRRTCRR
jgi:tripartite-type tricarboxylate transporter receptor subunit TctC